jgi:hypothetical protein
MLAFYVRDVEANVRRSLQVWEDGFKSPTPTVREAVGLRDAQRVLRNDRGRCCPHGAIL